MKETEFKLEYGLADALIFFVLTIGLSFPGYILLDILEWGTGIESVHGGFLVQLSSNLIGLWLMLKLRGVIGYKKYHFHKGELNFFDFVWVVLLAYGYYVFRRLAISPLIDMIPLPVLFDLSMDDFVGGPTMLLSTVIFAPIYEEMFYRGFLLEGLLKKHSPATAICLSALFFGLMHIEPGQAIQAGLTGLLLGLVYYKTKSLYLVIFMHMVNNGLVTYEYFLGLWLHESGNLIIGTLVFGLALYFMIRLPAHEYPGILKMKIKDKKNKPLEVSADHE